MKLKVIPAAHELISNMKSLFQLTDSKIDHSIEEPLREELFSTEQIEALGKSPATKHKISLKSTNDYLLKRLAENEKFLDDVRKLLNDTIKKKHQLTPPGEWLIDNFYLVEEHIRIAKTHFPKNYSEDLPQLLNEATKGLPRIYDIVLQIISHSDERIGLESLTSFIKAYQTICFLELGELWAILIMLRLALIENIRRISIKISIDRVDRNLADYWANEMIEKAEKDPKNLLLTIADMARSNPPVTSAFLSELTRHLRGKGPGLALSLTWIEQQLSESGLTSNALINAENQKQAADQVSISNSIGSLRLLGVMDWRYFVETNSVVEQTLSQDNGGTYRLMDFQTRDRYRHVVEHIAKKSKLAEHTVAGIAIRLMQENAGKTDQDNRTSHVGYYLIGPGVTETKKLAKMPVSIYQTIWQLFKRNNFLVYLSCIFLITSAISTAISFKAFLDTNNGLLLFSVVFLSAICASQLAMAVVNFISTYAKSVNYVTYYRSCVTPA